VNVFSTSKVMVALCALMLVDRGKIELDAPVAEYWPEFAQNGKEKRPVRQIFAHTSGVSAFAEPLENYDFSDWEVMTGLLAAQKPIYEPGTRPEYHGITFNFLLGELIRRVSGRSLAKFFREEVAEPLNADFHFGYSEKIKDRIGKMIRPTESQNTRIASTTSSAPVRVSESMGFGNAHSITRIGALMACGGELDGVRLLSRSMTEKIREEQSNGYDRVFSDNVRRGLGMAIKPEGARTNPNNFWWGGAGGSMLMMNPDLKMSYGYVMNKMSAMAMGDPRVSLPARALYRCLGK